MESVSQVIFALDRMVEINDQRFRLYKSLSDKCRELEMRLFFMQYAVQAQTFNATLTKWRNAYGAPLHNVKRESLFVTTMGQIKKMVGGRNYILRECEEMESNAIKTYQTALALSFLPSSTVEDIAKQSDELEKVRYTLRAIRENGAHQWEAAFA
ncbi:hypothetical protein BH09BAC3_BH09BAC3_16120 [soil metagenome]